MASLELTSIAKQFGAVEVIKGLNLTVEDGSFCALLGPSGCGKSTLLRMIAGLEAVTSGTIRIGNTDVTFEEPARRGVAMVFQNYALYPHLTVAENICFSLSLAGESKAKQAETGARIARMLQLESLMDRKPAQLSGGQRQRVAIGRALVRDPQVFLFDEPLSNLDALLRVQMRLELAKLHNDLKTTMVYVTHDQVEAMTLADKIIVLDKGVISQAGTPLELYNAPANSFVAGFIGSPAMNIVKARVTMATDGMMVDLGGSARLQVAMRAVQDFTGERQVEIGVRPEDLHIVDAANATLTGKVAVVEYLGNTSYVYLDTILGPMHAQADAGLKAGPGAIVGMAFDPAKVHIFDEAGRAWLAR